MNNGKVRIYELSRELSLENKDILAICEELNIAVKSHSSTITEPDAERIRTAAAKYSPAQRKPTRAAAPSKSGAPIRSSGVRPDGKRRQQILEIRKHKSSSGTNPKSPEPPIPPSSQPHASQPAQQLVTQPALPNRPDRPAPDETNLPAGKPDSPMRNVPVASKTTTERPKLVEPPLRASKGVEESPPTPLPNRPVLKRSKSEQPSPNAAPTSPVAAKVIIRNKQSDSSDNSQSGRTMHPPALELRRPRPARSSEQSEQSLTATVDSEIDREGQPVEESDPGEVPNLKLRRPALPRTPKRGKSWDEEEEEQAASKVSKTAAKNKRRLQPIIDDEEEEELQSLNQTFVDPIQVSLSLARPPKPKGKPGHAKPTTTSSAQKKNSASSRNGSNLKRGNRRERLEQEDKTERPQKLVLTGSLTVQELASSILVPETEIIKRLFFKGIAVNITETLDIPTAEMVAQELGVEVETAEQESEARKITEMLDAEDLENLHPRPPVVTIMGHVDHGKTTLLDSIRKTKVAQGEAGGITQHIGAYHVDIEHNGKTQQIVFLDTPGHEAFTAMRARGARVTDIAILVVAADDGVRPQTIEAISHAKAAGVPIVIAINKIDKEGAQPDRVKQELTEYDLVPEEWGGDTIMTAVSAIKGENLDTLLEMLLLVAEIEELSANPDRQAKGTVIEAHLDKAKGPVATLLIQNGTLRIGDVLVAGSVFGKVRAMMDDRGKRVTTATPSFAVEVLGLSDVPAAGDEFEVFPEEKEARAVASERTAENRQTRLQQAMASRRVTLGTLSARAQEGELKELNLILKADVQGSVEAILGSLKQLPQNQVQIRVLLSAPGEITETDVDLAAASDAVIIGFNTTLATGSRQAADRAGVDVRDYNIIYKLLEDIQGAMEGLLDPELVAESLGQAEVRAIFPVGRGAVAGCYVLSGKMARNCKLKVRRGNEIIYEGILDSLKRIREDVKEVNTGFECGIGVDNFHDWTEGDIIEAFQMVTRRRTLSLH